MDAKSKGCVGVAGLAEATDAVVSTPLEQLEAWQSGSEELPPVITTMIRGVPVRWNLAHLPVQHFEIPVGVHLMKLRSASTALHILTFGGNIVSRWLYCDR